MVAAVDWGASRSGHSWCSNASTAGPSHSNNYRWPSSKHCKTRTALLLMVPLTIGTTTTTDSLPEPEPVFDSFGDDACERFAELSNAERSRARFFHGFKRYLADDEALADGTRREFKTVDGLHSLSMHTVLRHCYEYLMRHAMDKMARALPGVALVPHVDVTWVVTVPPIWGFAARDCVRKAAVAALANAAASSLSSSLIGASTVPDGTPVSVVVDPANVILATESEAASLFCRWHDRASDSSFYNTSYMTVDAGGASVDVTIHQVSASGASVYEKAASSGGLWGSDTINEGFETLLANHVGHDDWKSWKASAPHQYLVLMQRFNAVKHRATPDALGAFHRIELPGRRLRALVKKHCIGERGGASTPLPTPALPVSEGAAPAATGAATTTTRTPRRRVAPLLLP